MLARVSWKFWAVSAVIVAEIAVLFLFAFLGRTGPADVLFARPGSASIQVEEQTGPWGVVAIKRVVAPAPSWVVVQARRPAGGGAVLGATPIPAGTSSNVSVALDPKQGAVNYLIVTLVVDRGQRGVLEFAGSGTGGGGGMGMGGASSAQASAPATQSVDKPLAVGDRPVSVVLRETSRIGVPGIVHRVATR